MKKQLVTAGIISAIGLTGAAGVSTASAMTGAQKGNRDQTTTQLAERFKLDENEVKSFFEEQQAGRQADREKQQAERLASAVKDGTLTQEQADLITKKTAENRAEHEADRNSDATREERQAERTEHQAEMKAWAAENGIPDSFMGQGPANGGQGHGPRGGANS